jgi:outer membrane immunogenic protein
MRALLFATTIFGLAAPATAADMRMPVKAPPPAAVVVYNWTGFYVGVDAGYHWAKIETFIPGVAASGVSTTKPDSFTVGGHIGYRHQFGNSFVLGVEADASWLDGDATGTFPGAPGQGFYGQTKWDASLRGILGIAANRTLFYVTGGWSWMGIEGCGVLTPAPATCVAGTALTDKAVDGWTVGGCIAHAFTDNLIARAEFLYADYGDFSYTGAGIAGGVSNESVSAYKARVGLSWKFGGPVIARY